MLYDVEDCAGVETDAVFACEQDFAGFEDSGCETGSMNRFERIGYLDNVAPQNLLSHMGWLTPSGPVETWGRAEVNLCEGFG